MSDNKTNSPLLGYNTNVRHSGHLFHIQTEDSGVEHPHIITHLFTEGTILSSKKTPYGEHLSKDNWPDVVRQMMKNQHKSMFVELRDGKHDSVAVQILGHALGEDGGRKQNRDKSGFTIQGDEKQAAQAQAIQPSAHTRKTADVDTASSEIMSIFDTPNADGSISDPIMSDKSLDDVIMAYLEEDSD